MHLACEPKNTQARHRESVQWRTGGMRYFFESNSRDRGIQLSKPIMNNQQPTDKAGSPRRLKVMKKDQTLYGMLAGSEEKGRGAMETAVYAMCILSVVAAILQ